MFSQLKLYREQRQTRRELRRLTDRELRDIGISRSDIYFISKGF
jgi:uncharacterized protein YjiS (DUF1127 family)